MDRIEVDRIDQSGPNKTEQDQSEQNGPNKTEWTEVDRMDQIGLCESNVD